MGIISNALRKHCITIHRTPNLVLSHIQQVRLMFLLVDKWPLSKDSNPIRMTFSSVQSFSRVRLFATTLPTAHQASLSSTNSQSLPKLNEHESEQTLGDKEGRGSLVCCSSRGCKELDTTDQGNNSNIGLLIIPRQQRQRILSFVRCYSATCG